jgi:hypothetical protein
MRQGTWAPLAGWMLLLAASACGGATGPDPEGVATGTTDGAVSQPPGDPRADAAPDPRSGVPGLTPDAGAPPVGGLADGGAGAGACRPALPPACDATPPDPGPRRGWRNGGPGLNAATGARHRGRDQLLPPGVPQWLIGKFAYGLLDSALVDEDVDVYLLRDCGASWQKLGTARTTRASQHPTVEGVEDDGGRVYWEIPAAQALAPGRHRARFVVAGDLSAAELFIEVVPPGTPFFVSDVDGTLTTSENADLTALLTGSLPEANADAAAALTLLAARGYRPLYLTARPEWLVARTREFLAAETFPPGLLHTTLGAVIGATGEPAARYKTAELAALAARGLVPSFLIGNTETDAQAYQSTGAASERRLFFRFTDSVHMGRRFDSYGALLSELAALPARCP